MLELSNGNQTTMPQAGMEILANYKPSVTFDMHPTGENLNRFVTAGALELSIRNRNIMTLQDIAARGYAHLPADESFAYKKDFLFVEKGIREITRQKELYRDYPFRQKMDELQNAARSLAQTPVSYTHLWLKKDIPSPKGSFPGFKYDSQLYPGGRMQHGSLFGML